MKKLFYLFTAVLYLILFNSCSTESTPVYQLTTSAEPSEAGSVSPNSGEYDDGDEVSITANANGHWVFDSWQGGHTGSTNPVTITMDSDKNITALFVKKEYPLTINTEGEGTVQERLVSQKTTDYEGGSVIELTAEPVEGWSFVHWSGDLDGTDNPVTVTIQSDLSITANFDNNPFAGGNGSELYPYQISSIDQLQSINDYTDKHFIQINDIDASETETWNNGKGFEPIGDDVIKFIGSYDGDNHEIKNLTINRPGERVGIFSVIGDSKIVNLQVVNANVHGGGGILFGFGRGNITIENISLTGKIVGGSGLGGTLPNKTPSNKAIINNLFLDVDVTTQGRAGGLLGLAEWNVNITNVKIIGDVEGGSGVGGIVGHAGHGTIISNSSAHGNVIGESYVGGLTGSLTHSTIRESHAFGNVTGKGNRVGGISGYFYNSSGTSYIGNVSSSGKIQGENYVGGLVGLNHGPIKKSVNKSNVNGINYVAGIVGANSAHNFWNSGIIENTYSSGNVNGASQVGGLVGINLDDSEIKYSFSSGEVIGEEDFASLIGVNGAIAEHNFCNKEINSSLSCVARGYSSGISELTTSEMTGATAEENMSEFDWENVWITTDGYPILRWQQE